MPETHVEIELIYDAAPEALGRLAATDRLGAARLGTTVVNDETDVYLDTPDRRLAAAGWACRLRIRRVEGAPRTLVSLKGPAEASDGALHRRPEIEGPATDDSDPAAWPASAARDLLDALRDGARLAPRVTLAQLRRERPVTREAIAIGTLSLDEVTVVHGGRAAGGFRRVELELLDGADEALLTELARDLASIPGLTAERANKLERALHLIEGGLEGRGGRP